MNSNNTKRERERERERETFVLQQNKAREYSSSSSRALLSGFVSSSLLLFSSSIDVLFRVSLVNPK